MDYKKVAILSSVAIVVVGAAVIGLIAWRSSQLGPPAGETAGVQAQPTGGQTTGSSSLPGSSTQSGAPKGGTTTGSAPSGTTVTAGAQNPGCDTSVDSVDCDYDNLPNGEERARKTDPLNPDSDGDGLLDGSEVYTWKTDPLNAHSVDASMTDLQAINSGKRSVR